MRMGSIVNAHTSMGSMLMPILVWAVWSQILSEFERVLLQVLGSGGSSLDGHHWVLQQQQGSRVHLLLVLFCWNATTCNVTILYMWHADSHGLSHTHSILGQLGIFL